MTTSHRVAIVTGGSRGIGAAISEKLAASGHAVVINYASRADEAEKLALKIAEAGGRAIAVKGDVADSAAMTALFDAAEKTFGAVDVLVANAGVLDARLPKIGETAEADFDRTFAVNVKGVFNLMQLAAKRLRDGGRIVTLSSSVLAMNLPGYGVYAASKAAVETLSRFLAHELRGRQITVNTVAPGPVATELFFAGKSEERVAQLAKIPPLERLGQPDDIASVVDFLVSQAGGWINGQLLRANGGAI
ncbi:MAG: SDR family oxidoreductase [Ferrovibrio sp.]|uniref:SDR family oxidoreductase n=1 Tax=Ferrovibrio sp. TaxID=1917215 RepID=UPI00260FCB63|nr:SDR family oxidoreductase [Ferrovibrio sp.]MCW0232253.1 SDR family oxidoreductase [Ferrovibrio sp.]